MGFQGRLERFKLLFHVVGNKLHHPVVFHIIAGSKLEGRLSQAERRWATDTSLKTHSSDRTRPNSVGANG